MLLRVQAIIGILLHDHLFLSMRDENTPHLRHEICTEVVIYFKIVCCLRFNYVYNNVFSLMDVLNLFFMIQP